MAELLHTAADWERELKNPQSPLYKLFMASLAKAADEEACLVQMLQYWVQKMELDKDHERHQAWRAGERAYEKMVAMQQPATLPFVPAKQELPHEKRELDKLFELLTQKQQQLMTQVSMLKVEVNTCNHQLVGLHKQWDGLQAAKADTLVTELKAQFEAGKILDMHGNPLLPPFPEAKLYDAMTFPSPEKQCHVNPSLLDRDATQVVKGGNVMAQFRMLDVLSSIANKNAPLTSSGAEEEIPSIAKMILGVIKNNKMMPKPVHTEKEVGVFSATQAAVKKRKVVTETMKVAEEALTVVRQDIKLVNEARTLHGHTTPTLTPPSK